MKTIKCKHIMVMANGTPYDVGNYILIDGEQIKNPISVSLDLNVAHITSCRVMVMGKDEKVEETHYEIVE